MNKLVRLAVAWSCWSLFLPSGVVWAQKIFQCKDASGRTITSDRPIPECEKAPVKEFGRDGLYRRDIPAPLTPEQIRQREQQEELRKQQEQVKRDQERRDAALLSIYRSENDIQAARQRALREIEKDLSISKERALKNNTELAEIQKTLNTPGKQPVTPDVVRRKTDLEVALKAEVALQQDLLNHIAKTNLKYDQEIQRFREIMRPNANPAVGQTLP